MEQNLVRRATIKSPTNSGDPCKQYLYDLRNHKDQEDGLVIIKLILCKAGDELWEDLKLLKVYKGMELREQRFGIKLATLALVGEWLNKGNEILKEDEPHGCIDYSQGSERCKEQCKKCKDLES